MSLRHLTGVQNKALADLLFATAKTVGAAAVIALFFPSAGQDWPLGYLFGALVCALLLSVLGILILGRAGDGTEAAKRTTKRKEIGE